jgi:hypothetical protein
VGVGAILATHDSVWVGGTFASIAGAPRQGFAAFDMRTQALLPISLVANGGVIAFADYGDRLALGGSFTSIGGQPRLRLAMLDKATNSILPWSCDADSGVSRLAPHLSSLAVCGVFAHLKGQPVVRLGALDPADGTVLPPGPFLNDRITAMVSASSQLIVCGLFTGVDSLPNRGLARISVATLDVPRPRTSGPPRPGLRVQAVGISDGRSLELRVVSPQAGNPTLELFDLQGRVAARTRELTSLAPGSTLIRCEGVNLAPGAYAARVRLGSGVAECTVRVIR